mgnify:CR=1 FL=1
MITSRHDQTYPRLTTVEVDRIRRFGDLREYRDGELLFEVEDTSESMMAGGGVALDVDSGAISSDAVRRRPV